MTRERARHILRNITVKRGIIYIKHHDRYHEFDYRDMLQTIGIFILLALTWNVGQIHQQMEMKYFRDVAQYQYAAGAYISATNYTNSTLPDDRKLINGSLPNISIDPGPREPPD